jgi:hypothetical protein
MKDFRSCKRRQDFSGIVELSPLFTFSPSRVIYVNGDRVGSVIWRGEMKVGEETQGQDAH